MIATITLAITAKTAGGPPVTFERTIENLDDSHFCPKDGDYAGWLTVPKEGCRVNDFMLNSGYSISFTATDIECSDKSLRMKMSDPVVSRDRVLHDGLSRNSIIEILSMNGWRCPAFAAE